MTTDRAEFRGVDSRGVGHFGSIPPDADIAAMVEHWWRRGWRELTVTRDGETVAGIGDDPLTAGSGGRRTWWAVSS